MSITALLARGRLITKHLFVICIMIAGLCFGVSAEATGAINDIKSSSTKVIVSVSDNTIYVAEHSTRTDYYMGSVKLISNYLSAQLYNLSYVDENKQDISATRVLSGYVKAVLKTDDTVIEYIPIKPRRAEESAQEFGVKMYFSSVGGSTGSNVTGIAGKSTDDKAYVLTPPSTGLSDKWDYVSHDLKSNLGYVDKDLFTSEFNMYANGNSIVRVNFRYSVDDRILFEWRADGSLYMNENGSMVQTGSFEREKWHRVGVTYDPDRSRYIVFIDGQKMGDNSYFFTESTALLYGLGKGSSTGRIALDDIRYYRGYYYPELYYTPATMEAVSNDVLVDKDSKTIYGDLLEITNIETLQGLISTNATRLGVIGSSEVLTESSVIAAQEREIYTYYKIKPAIYCENVTFNEVSGGVSVTAILKNMLPKTTSAIMVMVIKNPEGTIEKVLASEQKNINSQGTELIVSTDEDNVDCVEVFFISDWNTRIGLMKNIYSN